MVQDRDVFTIQIVSDLPSYLPIASLFKCDVWHSCAEADMNLTDVEHGVVPLRQLSF